MAIQLTSMHVFCNMCCEFCIGLMSTDSNEIDVCLAAIVFHGGYCAKKKAGIQKKSLFVPPFFRQ